MFRFQRLIGSTKPGFTLLEVLIAITIIGILYATVYGRVGQIVGLANEARAKAELAEMNKATNQMVIDNLGEWPADVHRGVPPGIEDYLGPGNWPDAPWAGSEYDWDNFTGSDGQQVYQISIRFCEYGDSSGETCRFPDEPWATGFDYHSSYYYCIQGKCRAHPGKPDDHPGYCVNCQK